MVNIKQIYDELLDPFTLETLADQMEEFIIKKDTKMLDIHFENIGVYPAYRMLKYMRDRYELPKSKLFEKFNFNWVQFFVSMFLTYILPIRNWFLSIIIFLCLFLILSATSAKIKRNLLIKKYQKKGIDWVWLIDYERYMIDKLLKRINQGNCAL